MKKSLLAIAVVATLMMTIAIAAPSAQAAVGKNNPGVFDNLEPAAQFAARTGEVGLSYGAGVLGREIFRKSSTQGKGTTRLVLWGAGYGAAYGGLDCLLGPTCTAGNVIGTTIGFGGLGAIGSAIKGDHPKAWTGALFAAGSIIKQTIEHFRK